jgi:2,4-dienoyl-CoA reductase-like NADH-dependent reductase (Old Yellow Enzyme family)
MSFEAKGSLLFAPLDLRGLRLENRIVLPAMVTRLSGEDGLVNDDIRDRYLRFARGEPGLMVLEAMGVDETKSGPLLRASHARFVPALRDLSRALHDASPTKVAAQIIHFLKISRSGWRQRIQDLDRAATRSCARTARRPRGSATRASTPSSCTWRTPIRSPPSSRA